jgi:hypothetical protein
MFQFFTPLLFGLNNKGDFLYHDKPKYSYAENSSHTLKTSKSTKAAKRRYQFVLFFLCVLRGEITYNRI